MVGPPGCGKTRLAHHLPKLLPPLADAEALTVTRIHSVAGVLPERVQLQQERPFRAPHHRCTPASLLGGGLHPQPGELSLAHAGVLFLDELAEFPRTVLDQLRQPLEEGVVRLSRARRRTEFPCVVTLVAATNPCPCGWYGDRDQACRCSPIQRRRYWQRLSGPLLDRIDLQLRLERPCASSIRSVIATPTSCQPLHDNQLWHHPDRINAARQRMQHRNPGGCSNRELNAEALGERGGFHSDSLRFWERLIQSRSLSTRSALQLLRVARTIADLQGIDQVSTEMVAEASTYRCTDLLTAADAL